MAETLVARVSKWKVVLLILAAAGFVGIGIWFLADADRLAAESRNALLREPAMIYLFGALSVLLGLLVGGALVPQLFRTRPVLEIDARGILWRRWSDAIIPWDAIMRAEPRSVHRSAFLCLWLDAPERYRRRTGLGRLAAVNKGMGFGDIALSTQGTNVSFDRLLDVVESQLRARAAQRVGKGSAPE